MEEYKVHFHRLQIANLLEDFKWESLLEVGSGPGDNLLHLRDRFPKVELVGLDNNKSVIDKYAERCKDFRMVFANIIDMPFKDKSFDVILADAVLMYCGKQESLKEIKRVAKKAIVICDRVIEEVKPFLGEPDKHLPIKGWGADWDSAGYISLWKLQ